MASKGFFFLLLELYIIISFGLKEFGIIRYSLKSNILQHRINYPAPNKKTFFQVSKLTCILLHHVTIIWCNNMHHIIVTSYLAGNLMTGIDGYDNCCQYLQMICSAIYTGHKCFFIYALILAVCTSVCLWFARSPHL